jgi:hypothetical protein
MLFFVGGGRREEERERERGREGERARGAEVFFYSSFSMAFHSVPFFWSRNASRETVPISVFLLFYLSSNKKNTAKFELGCQVF